MTLEASVIIPTYDDWHVLQKCLNCLSNQSVAQDRFEVIIANNNADPQVPDSLHLPGNTRVIHAPKPGSYAARNAALREATADALFFTDSDCQPDRRWIENGLAALADLRPIDRIAGGIELFPKGKTWTGPELYDRAHSLRQSVFASRGWCATANLVVRRAAFDLVGPFNEEAFSGGDKNWGLRAAGLGSRIVLSEPTLIRHPARENFAVLAKKARRLAGNRHYRDLVLGKRERSTLGYLWPRAVDLRRTLLQTDFSAEEKLRVLGVQYRLCLVVFAEFVRLRYLSRAPQRS